MTSDTRSDALADALQSAIRSRGDWVACTRVTDAIAEMLREQGAGRDNQELLSAHALLDGFGVPRDTCDDDGDRVVMQLSARVLWYGAKRLGEGDANGPTAARLRAELERVTGELRSVQDARTCESAAREAAEAKVAQWEAIRDDIVAVASAARDENSGDDTGRIAQRVLDIIDAPAAAPTTGEVVPDGWARRPQHVSLSGCVECYDHGETGARVWRSASGWHAICAPGVAGPVPQPASRDEAMARGVRHVPLALGVHADGCRGEPGCYGCTDIDEPAAKDEQWIRKMADAADGMEFGVAGNVPTAAAKDEPGLLERVEALAKTLRGNIAVAGEYTAKDAWWRGAEVAYKEALKGVESAIKAGAK